MIDVKGAPGTRNASVLATYIVEKGKPLLTLKVKRGS